MKSEPIYEGAAIGVLALHLAWLVFVIFGAFFTRRRKLLTGIHLASLVWGLAVEVGPWPCPLTSVEQELWERAKSPGYSGGFLLHYLDALVYPGVPESALVAGAIAVCVLNIAVYCRRMWISAGRAARPE